MSSDRPKKPTAYLSGAMEYAPDNGEGWRRELASLLNEKLGHAVFNPNEEIKKLMSPEERESLNELKENDFDKFRENIRRIIDHDLNFITEKTDYLICYWDEYASMGGGTQGEVTVAYNNGLPVYLLTQMPLNRISSWILGCSEKIFNDRNSLLEEIENRYDKMD